MEKTGSTLKPSHSPVVSQIGRLTAVADQPFLKSNLAKENFNGSPVLRHRFPPRTDRCFVLW